ncbi:M28 family peptidase [Pyxidicoccus trucidator]|uniref:M28 family peptidase n=1 Tax=Pyxidicoccus trucidator TaxID=2709662 RepID=UPI0013DC706C|nr:M28 family peptidase [Pyxidicoccus trucidator]
MSVPEKISERRGGLRAWLTGLGLTTVLLALNGVTDRLPMPRPAEAPPSEFSEARAAAVVRVLSEEIGPRVPGMPGHRKAAEHLLGLLRAMPGVEAELQDVTGTYLDGDTMVAYRTQNVVARLAGRRPDALLLSAHYDSTPESSGAADDAAGTAALVEVARALASGPPLENTVLFNLNGAEEYCLCGSAGFLRHRWARDVRGFVNLEATGMGGQSVLFQAGPGSPWLLEAYARAAPRPEGNVLGQDLFAHDLIPAATDGLVYRQAGLPGLDVAFFRDGHAIHSALDRLARLEPGSLQHMGDNALAVTRELAGQPLRAPEAGAPPVFFDVWGRWLVAYGPGAAAAWAIVAGGLAAVATVFAARRARVAPGRIAAGGGIALLSLTLALLVPVALSLVPPYVLGRPHGWYATPWLASAGFGALSLAGALLPRWLWQRRWVARGIPPAQRVLAAWSGGLWVWLCLLVAAQAAGLGTAYLALGWVLGGALGLAAAASVPPRLRALVLYAGWAAGMLLTLNASSALLDLFIPVAGRLPLPFPADPLIALIAALPVAAGALLGLAPVLEGERLGVPLAASALGGALLLGAIASSAPYTPEHPKRMWLEHRQSDAGTQLLFSSWDHPDARGALSAFGDLRSVQGLPGARLRYGRPASSLELLEPRVEVLESRFDEATASRTVRLRFPAGADYLSRVTIPAGVLRGWSLSEELPPSDGAQVLELLGAPDAGWEISLRLAGQEPVPLEFEDYFSARSPEVDAVLSRMPPWTTTNVRFSTHATLKL